MNQLMLTKSYLKLTKNASHLMLKALFVPEIFLFLSFFFGYVQKHLDNKVEFSSKIYDITDRTRCHYNRD